MDLDYYLRRKKGENKNSIYYSLFLGEVRKWNKKGGFAFFQPFLFSLQNL
jgi:hypothetical protein